MATNQTKEKVSFPSAFTILFLLLILIAATTWLAPAGSYDYDKEGAPIPGTYKEVPPNPQALLSSALKGPINGIASGFAVTTLSDGLIGRLVLLAFVVMVYGVITDTVLYIPLSFLIPSTSGLATVSMPTMAPLAQFAGVAPYLPGSAF